VNVPREIVALLQPKLEPFVGRQLTPDVTSDVRAAVQDIDPHLHMIWRAEPSDTPGSAFDRHLHLIMGSSPEGMPPPAPPPPPVDFGPAPDGTQRIRVGGNVQHAKKSHHVAPEYPALARQARIQGTVRYAVLIGKEGDVEALRLISGHPLLVKNSTEAVQQWKYQPTLLNGNPVEVQTTVDVNFTLAP
jgi:protein TonB